MENNRHRLIERQITKYLKDFPNDHPGFASFIEAINEAYRGFEDDHNQLERTLELSSLELYRANQALNQSKHDLEEIVMHRTQELLSTNEKLILEINERNETEIKLKSYAHQLERKNNELDKFAYIVSHDLKAPLRAISNLTSWIEEDIGEKLESESKSHFDLLRGRTVRMEALIQGILDYSRVGKMQPDLHIIDTNLFVNELIDSLHPPSNFKLNVERNLPVIKSEKIALEQLFSNYISNAIKYNDNPEPEINISYNQKDGYHEFCVADNGPGIEPQYHEQIFVIFQTLNARDKVESTGVGLAIVRKIILEKGGNAWVESDKDIGAHFYFSLPVQDLNGVKM